MTKTNSLAAKALGAAPSGAALFMLRLVPKTADSAHARRPAPQATDLSQISAYFYAIARFISQKISVSPGRAFDPFLIHLTRFILFSVSPGHAEINRSLVRKASEI